MEHKCKKTDLKTVEKCELNREQVIKGLECCGKYPCEQCPYYTDAYCPTNLRRDALSLIKELTAENKLLNVELGNAGSEILRLIDREKELTEENESLKQCMEHEHASFMEIFGQYGEKCDKLVEENEKLRLDVEVCGAELSRYTENIVQMAKQDRADTVRQMHSEIKERCIKGGIYPAFVASTIDQIVEEMLEGGTK